MKRYTRSNRGSGVLILIYILFFAVVIFFSFFRGMFVDESIAIRAMEIQGYSNVEVTDHAWFLVGMRGCDSKDAARFTVKATNPVGKDIQCYVCTGWIFKGATIRTR